MYQHKLKEKEEKSDLYYWLGEFNLEKFEPIFLRYGINLTSLSILNEDNLIEMGIPDIDIFRIVQALSTLQGNSLSEAPKIDDEEIRYLVFLVCDIVNSTQYHAGIDIEKSAIFSSKYHSTILNYIRINNGVAIRSTGDGIEAMFGYPVYSEDSMSEAIKCGLGLTEELSRIHSDEFNSIGVRVGIASGETVIRKFRGRINDFSSDNFGVVAYRAARLQSVAQRNTVFVDNNVWSETNSSFDYVDMGRQHLRGFKEDHQLWKVSKPKGISTRFERRTRKSHFIGRRKEIDVIKHTLNLVQSTESGKIGYIWGEPGIGKSRLVHEIFSRENNTPFLHIVFQCSENYADTPYRPILEYLKCDLNIVQSTSNIRTVLEEFLGKFPIPLEKSYPLFVRLLTGKEEEESLVGTEEQEQMVGDVLAAYFSYLSFQKPLVLVLEDVQWADSSTVRAVNYLINEKQISRTLICVTSRNEVMSGFDVEFDFVEQLQKLDSDSANALFDSVTENAPIAAIKRERILQYAEGNPFYIEELTAGSMMEHTRPRKERNLTLSSALKSSLLVRLDSLEDAKDLAKIAALIGRRFDLTLLREVSNMSQTLFETAIQKLDEENVLRVDRQTNSGVFKHALLQEASRSMLLSNTRANLHLKIVNTLEKNSRAEEVPEFEILAHHYTEARDYTNAIRNWLLHGGKLAKTWAKSEAATIFERALKLVNNLDHGIRRTELELDILVELGDILYAHYGYLTLKAEQAYDRSLAISRQLNKDHVTNRILDGVFGIRFNAGEFEGSIKTGIDLVNLYNSSCYFPSLVLGKQFQGMGKYHLADFHSAERLLESCLVHTDRTEEIGSHYPSMPLTYLAWTKFKLGKSESALKLFNEAEKIALSKSHYEQSACRGNGCILYSMMGNSSKVKELVDQLLETSERFGFRLWSNIGKFFEGWLLAIEQDDSGILQMQEMVDSMTHQLCDKTLFLGLLADSYANVGDEKNAFRLVDEAISLGKLTGEKYYFDELYLLKERLSLSSNT